MPAPAFRQKGRIKEGADADLAIFEKPDLPSEGIPFAVVNGLGPRAAK